VQLFPGKNEEEARYVLHCEGGGAGVFHQQRGQQPGFAAYLEIRVRNLILLFSIISTKRFCEREKAAKQLNKLVRWDSDN
jgi:hypothetical protein